MGSRAWLLLVAAAVLAVAGSGAAFAMPSLGGPSGIVSVPNALVAPTGEVEGALSWQRLKVPRVPTGTEDVSNWSLQVLGGFSDGAELWAAYSKANDQFDTKSWGVGAKLQFALEPQEPATLAIGGSFQKGSGGARVTSLLGMYSDVDFDTDVTKLYVVATKELASGGGATRWGGRTRVLGTVGLLWAKATRDETSRSDLGTEKVSTDQDLLRPFAGVEFSFAGVTSVGLEYRAKDSDLDEKAIWSVVASHLFDQGIVGEIGITNADPLGFGLKDRNIFARVGYTFALGY